MGANTVAAACMHTLLDAAVVNALRDVSAPGSTRTYNLEILADKFLPYVFIYGLFVTGVSLIRSTARAREQEQRLAAAEAAASQVQIAALRFQLNPHFLFNTLNALSSLVVTRRNADAEVMIGKPSEFLRASLASDPHSFITLDEELATIESYLDIEAVRFGQRLTVEVACAPALGEAQVPSLVLQPLVENAIKYGVARSRRPVTIRLVAETDEAGGLRLTVSDDGGTDAAADSPAPVSTGTGLRNVRRRLEALYGERGILTAGPGPEGGFVAVVRLPPDRTARPAFAATSAQAAAA